MVNNALLGPDIFNKPSPVELENGRQVLLVKIDTFFIGAGLCAVGGWTSMPMCASLKISAQYTVQGEKVFRPDVNIELKANDTKERGFACIASSDNVKTITLLLENVKKNISVAIPLDIKNATTRYDPAFAGVLGVKLDAFLQNTINKSVFLLKQTVRCGLDITTVLINSHTGHLMLLSGWIAMPEGAKLCLENESAGVLQPLKLYHYKREDIKNLLGDGYAASFGGYGFVSLADSFPSDATKLNLVVKLGTSNIKICELKFAIDLSYAQFIIKLFSVPLAPTEMADCYKEIYWPILKIAQENFHVWLGELPQFENRIGNMPASPLTSVIIPLYGGESLKLLDTQVMTFAEDIEFKHGTELIYVIDDPGLLNEFKIKIDELYSIYNIPIRYVYKNINQGFAAANNLGASIAKGKTLIFLNSDVFPEHSGWINQLRTFLDEHPDIGLIGCRMLYPDGSLQHAGMSFRKRDSLGIWTNVQPLAGLSPALDTTKNPTEMPLVTGACIAMRHSDFDAIGGWSTDYIVGDFEDSDICLKIAHIGKKTVYFPNVSLVHLERQSFKSLGENAYKTRLAIYNSVVHQKKWEKEIVKLFAENQ